MRSALQIIDVNNAQLEEVLHRVEQSLDEKDVTLIRAVFQSYLYVTDLVEDKNTSIRRLRQLLFGARTEKTDAVAGQRTDGPEATMPRGAATGTESAALESATEASDAADTEPTRPGHGRNGVGAYRGAERVNVPHPSLTAGAPCPRAYASCLLQNTVAAEDFFEKTGVEGRGEALLGDTQLGRVGLEQRQRQAAQ